MKALIRGAVVFMTLVILSFSVLALGPLIWPLPPEYPLDFSDVTNLFGERVHPIYGDVRTHTGIDIQAPNGTTIYAIGNATVVAAEEKGGWGNVIILELGTNKEGKLVTCMYCHLPYDGMKVTPGQTVSQGQELGITGETGTTQGGHLHFEIAEDGEQVDPLGYIGDNPTKVVSGTVAPAGDEAKKDFINGIISEYDLLGMPDYEDLSGCALTFPKDSDLSQVERNKISNLKEAILGSKENSIINIANVVVAGLGILCMLYSVLLFVGYIFDRSNVFFDISLIGILTLGRCRLWEPELGIPVGGKDCNGVLYMGTTTVIRSCIIAILVGFLLVSGYIVRVIVGIFYYIAGLTS